MMTCTYNNVEVRDLMRRRLTDRLAEMLKLGSADEIQDVGLQEDIWGGFW